MNKRIILTLITIILPSWALPKPKANAQTVEQTKKSRFIKVRGETFTARAQGGSRPEAIRIAHRRAAEYANGRSYKVNSERVSVNGTKWVCILSCEIL